MSETRECNTFKDNKWNDIARFYEFIEDAQISNSFIILMALEDSEKPFSTIKIYGIISSKSGEIFLKSQGHSIHLKKDYEN